MKPYRLLLTLTLILSGVLTAKAASLTPSEVAHKILEASPASRADEMGIASLSETLKSAGNLPDPEIEGEYLFATGNEKNRWGAGVSWGLEWPGVYAARRNEAAGKLTAAEAAAALARHDRLIEIKRLLLDYVLLKKQTAVLNEIQATNDSIMSLSQKAERHGELTRLDMNKLRLEHASLTGNIMSLQESIAETVMNLNILYGGDCNALLNEMVCEFPEIEEHEGKWDLTAAPSVQAAQAEAEAAKKSLYASRAESYPGLRIGYQHAFEDGAHFNGASLGISIPLFSSRGKKAAAKAAIAEAEFKAEQAAAEARMEMEGSERRLVILLRQADEMSAVIEDNDNTALLLKAYKGGIMTLTDYLNERNYFINSQLELLTIKHSAANLLLDMEKISKNVLSEPK